MAMTMVVMVVMMMEDGDDKNDENDDGDLSNDDGSLIKHPIRHRKANLFSSFLATKLSGSFMGAEIQQRKSDALAATSPFEPAEICG